jgi:hypothetical protein
MDLIFFLQVVSPLLLSMDCLFPPQTFYNNRMVHIHMFSQCYYSIYCIIHDYTFSCLGLGLQSKIKIL